MFFDKVVIIGIGLVGGSVGLALKSMGVCGKIVGLGRSRSSLETGVNVGAIDEAATGLAEAVEGANLIVVCTPVGSIAGIIAEMESMIDDDCVITDVGSTKRNIVYAVEQLPRASSMFVGSHPLAGSERKGARHASGQLFRGATVFLTPTPTTDTSVMETIRGMWECVGGKVVVVDPAVHDRIVARTSHLPHILAALLVACLRSLPVDSMGLMGKGFLDTTRIASSDPEIWADICTENLAEIREAIFSLREDLDEFERYMNEGEYEKILEFFNSAKLLRDSFEHQRNNG